MMNNLFSSFDMKNYFINFFLIMNLFIFIFLNTKKIVNKFNLLFNLFKKFIFLNVCTMNYFISMFIMIFSLNFFSLNFFYFNLTSQFSMNFMLIFINWFPIMLLNLSKKKILFLMHLVPFGTINLLIPMMVLIELLSFFIRPLTLFLRLSINMIAGHVLMNLLSNLSMTNLKFIFIMYLYMIMKFLVSIIQAFIIITLLNLYMEEI